MLMTLTWKHPQGHSIDIQVNEDQTLIETWSVLINKGFFLTEAKKMVVLQSERTKKRLNMGMTYKESQIYTGDVLIILS